MNWIDVSLKGEKSMKEEIQMASEHFQKPFNTQPSGKYKLKLFWDCILSESEWLISRKQLQMVAKM